MKLRDPKSSRLNSKRRPLSLGRSTNLVWAVLPSIAIVAALFVGFSYLSYFVREYMDQDKVLVRSVDGVVKRPKPFLEQTPPRSPEAVMEEHKRKLGAERAAGTAQAPNLEPDYESDQTAGEPIELIPVEIAPLEVPGLAEEKSQ